MPFIIGTDEAGYGPNLGPLIVGATLWQVPDDINDLYDALATVICRAHDFSGAEAVCKIPLGDSKALFQSRGSLATLERSVLSMLGATEQVPDSLIELFGLVANQTDRQLASQTTYCWNDVRLPVSCDRDEVDSMSMRIREELAARNIICHRIAASVVFPAQFNLGLTNFGNKAGLLTTLTCRLVRSLIDSLEHKHPCQVTVFCDRHGGRSHYAGWIQQEMTESFVRVVHENRHSSCYRWQESGRAVEASFLVNGERYLPIGLASMIAKYLRELSMNAWNRFWREQMPALHPTAGYPQDAKRFKQEMPPLQMQLNVDDWDIWREK